MAEVDPVPQIPAPAAEKPAAKIAPTAPAAQKPSLSSLSWQEYEKNYLSAVGADSPDTYYAEEQKKANTLHGVIKPYNSFVSSRPGDFVLINLKTNLPIAYLYSTKTDLASCINKPVTLWVSERPNNNFAFPAYFVMQVEE